MMYIVVVEILCKIENLQQLVLLVVKQGKQEKNLQEELQSKKINSEQTATTKNEGTLNLK